MILLLVPDSIASSIMYCKVGLSTIGNISFGCDFVAGRNLVPNPAAGIMAFLTLFGCDFVAGRNLVPNPAAGIMAFLTLCFILLLPQF